MPAGPTVTALSFKKHLLILAQKREWPASFAIIHPMPPNGMAAANRPIEHRLFPHIHNAMKGVVLSDYNLVKELLDKTKTDTGLKVVVRLTTKKYPIGIKTIKSEIDLTEFNFIPNS